MPLLFFQRKKATGHYIESDKWRDIIYQAKEMGPRWVVFAGSGEELLGDMSLGLIEYANSLAMRSVVFTNGILVSRDIAQFFSRKS